MASTNRVYGTEGSSALVPSYPTLTLLEGGTGKPFVVERQHEDRSCRDMARGNVLTAIVCTFLVSVGLVAALLVSNAAVSSRKEAALASLPGEEVVVEAGDSVWGLAFRHPVDGYSTAELVQWITEKNSLESPTLQPGQSVVVPASN
ncbi:LysM peptidoglycan-binding domain-containing protein [Olsenella sp. Marseille-P4559]|jgi:hypothetical protein|uniref:LysM peptidoglycan-binding domain-containing protein n=1 Tax=Olsenella sp. Marseille-P4559 TaxID=2364795 RepID=UPI00103018FD|nr:LysM peptidoglycan-binding domain-containing protein [Olsenella sp. Marseille-P4559]